MELAKLLPQSPWTAAISASTTTIMSNPDGSTSFETLQKTPIFRTPLQWVRAFSTYMGYHTFYFQHLAGPMASYLCYMSGKLGKYPLEVCLAYDHQFRQYLARYPQVKWETPNIQLVGLHFTQLLSPYLSHHQHSGHQRSSITTSRVVLPFIFYITIATDT